MNRALLLITSWIAATGAWASVDKFSCGDSARLASLSSQADVDPLIQVIACRQNAWENAPASHRAALESSLDSLTRRLPQAQGYWHLKLSAWSLSTPLSTIQAKALGRLLGDLPELGAKSWREVAENRLERGDTLSTGLFALRAAAADSQSIGYAQARLNTLLSLASSNDEAMTRQTTRQRQVHLDSAVSFWSRPWTWQNPWSYQALELALWSANRPEAALSVLRSRLGKQGNPRHYVAWFKAARQLHMSGRNALALIAMGSADYPAQDKDWQQALPLILRLALHTGKTTLATRWAEKALAVNRLRLGNWPPEWRLNAAEVCLREGNIATAQAWLGSPWPAEYAESRDLWQARIFLAQEKPEDASKLLSRLKNASRQTLSNGAVLKAQGLVALWRHRVAEAESLLTLASAYVEDPEVQGVLEMRRWILLDTGMAVTHLLQGQAEAPRSPAQKSSSLAAIDSRSPLWPDAQWSLADLHLALGETQEAIACYRNLTQAKTHARSQEAKARLIYLTETENANQAIAAYEDLLVESQQGVPAEFARERLRLLGP